MRLPGLPNDPRIMDSSDALELPEFSGGLLVIGGGIIGLEMACVFDALGSRVSVVELTPTLMPGCDPDLVRPLERRIRARYEQILLGTRVAGIEPQAEGLKVSFEGEKAPAPQRFDRVLVAVGRSPNGKAIGAELAGVKVSERGFIPVDKQMRTNVPHIFAIGDIAGAADAGAQGDARGEGGRGSRRRPEARLRCARDSLGRLHRSGDRLGGPHRDRGEGQGHRRSRRAHSPGWQTAARCRSGREDGFTKLLFDPESHRVLGGGIVGTNAGDLISEVALAIESGCDAADIGLTIHPHPTLSETVAAAAEAFEGTLTDLYIPKKK